jgi:ABC-type bacteriocin/lantibiotic exporter with double-glycine peptidase domain
MIFGAEATYWGDVFHDYVVAPILIFALFAAAIIIVAYGNLIFIALALALLTVWAFFLGLDVTQGRLDQQAYRKKLGKS